MKYLLLILAFVFSCSVTEAQKQKNYKKHPYWIDMIKDPNVNYFEAVKAYETFWKGKRIPKEEEELIGQTKGESGKEDNQSRKEMKEKKREKELYRKYGLECKKFEHWKMKVKPYVQPDGRIITDEERLKMWQEENKK